MVQIGVLQEGYGFLGPSGQSSYPLARIGGAVMFDTGGSCDGAATVQKGRRMMSCNMGILISYQRKRFGGRGNQMKAAVS